MIAEAISALSILKSAGETAKSLIELRDVSAVREKAIELQSKILSAQQIALDSRSREEALIADVRNLEQQIAKLKEWGAESDAYILTTVAPGAFAYSRNPDAQPTEPPHWLCTKCYSQHQKSILQYAGRTPDRHYSIHACHTCGGKIQTPWSVSPETLAAPSVQVATTPVKCPYCKSKTKLASERDHPQLGPVGVKEHELQCLTCNRSFTRTFSDDQGYA